MKLGRTNKDVIRVIKETLLTIATQDNIAKKNATKSKVTYINDNIQGNYDDNYYQCNYGVFSDEKIAEINAINQWVNPAGPGWSLWQVLRQQPLREDEACFFPPRHT